MEVQSDQLYYSFDQTNALLTSLSSSSGAPTLSPDNNSDYNGNNASSKSSLSEHFSPDEQFFNHDWQFANSANNSNNNHHHQQQQQFQQDNEQNPYIQDVFDLNNFPSHQGHQQFPLINTEYVKQEEFFKLPASSTFNKSNESNDNNDNENNDANDNEDDDEEDFDEEEQDTRSKKKNSVSSINSKSSKVSKQQPLKKDRTVHNVIEKKYRTNINTKIMALRNAVPSLRIAAGDESTTIDDLDGLSPAAKVNKASVLSKATEYIKHLEQKTKLLMKENDSLKQYISSLSQNQQIFNQYTPVGSQQQPQAQQQLYQYQPQQQPHQPQQPPPRQQPVYQQNQYVPAYPQVPQQQQFQMNNTGKILMGGMATMMAQSMLNSNSGTNNNMNDFRGLNSIPMLSSVNFFKIFNVLKIVLIFTSFSYLLLSVFKSFEKKEKKEKKSEDLKQVRTENWIELTKSLILIKTGNQARTVINDDELNQIINKELFTKGDTFSILKLIFLYLKLEKYETTSEVIFCKIFIGNLLVNFSDLFKFFKINHRNDDLLMELNQIDLEENPKLNQLVKDLVKNNGNTETFKRVLNVIMNNDINFNCHEGYQDLTYGLIVKDENYYLSSADYKDLIIDLRSNEIFRNILLKYIRLSFNNEGLNKNELKMLKFEIWNSLNSVENSSNDDGNSNIISLRVKLFKSILNEKYLDSVLEIVNEEEEDEEREEGVEEEEEEKEEEVMINSHFKNSVSPDLFNSLTCSTILKYVKLNEKEQVLKLLKFLNFDTKSEEKITLLSFISFLKLLEKFPEEWIDNKECKVIKNLCIFFRLWIGDSNNLKLKNIDIQLKRKISDSLVKIGKKFNNVVDLE